MSIKIRTVFANGLDLPALGQGGWNIGDCSKTAEEEATALRRGIELGANLIDTAEMYGDGDSERLIGDAVKGIPRSEYILVSKVLPQNAGRKEIFKSCDMSLKRLQADFLDLYLLHWRGSIPLEETVQCMEELVRAGKIRRWGVSNFDTSDMENLWNVPHGKNCAANQVLYNLGSRGIEYDLIPWMRSHGMAVMAYCPLAQAGMLKRMNHDFVQDETLVAVSKRHGISVMQLMLAFVLRQDNIVAIPKSGSVRHTEQNAAVLQICISDEEWAEIDKVFWPPTEKMHLDIE